MTGNEGIFEGIKPNWKCKNLDQMNVLIRTLKTSFLTFRMLEEVISLFTDNYIPYTKIKDKWLAIH